MSIPTESEVYAQIMEHLRKVQEGCAMMSHLKNANDHHRDAMSWLNVSENFKKIQHTITLLARRGFH